MIRSQVPGERGRSGEVGEWQCEVRWGARRMVARREQGAVGNVSRGEWGNSKTKKVITNPRIPGKKWWKMEKSCPVAAWEYARGPY